MDPSGLTVGSCAACGAALPATARFCSSCGRSVEVPSSDERRLVTILFADIVGSTSFAERLDAEDWKAIVDPALARFTAVIESHGGRVAQLLGDGLLAFFGAPVVHEDDAIRAVRAGLGLVEATRKLGSRTVGSPEAHLEIRVGISSGEVVVGAVGGGDRREYLAVGDAVNVAARLQAAAPPMGVLVSDETFRLVAAAVEGRAAVPLSLKGKADPVVAHEIVALRTVVGHGRRVRESGPLVGREEELGRLASLRERLEAGTGAVVSVVGEPGLGKTRLVREWHRSLEHPGQPPHPVRWVEAACLTTGRDLPYHLAKECLRGMLEVAGEPDPASRAPRSRGDRPQAHGARRRGSSARAPARSAADARRRGSPGRSRRPGDPEPPGAGPQGADRVDGGRHLARPRRRRRPLDRSIERRAAGRGPAHRPDATGSSSA